MAALLNDVYEDRMKSVSKVTCEMNLITYTNLESIQRRTSQNIQYLVFKQSEKQALLKHKFSNVLTIHEYQCKQAYNIMVIRTSRKKEAIINDSDSHRLVAINRHRKSFTYVTPNSTDGISQYVNRSKTLSAQQLDKCSNALRGG